MNKDMKCAVGFTLTIDESMKLQELCKKLKLPKSKLVGLLITKAQTIQAPGRKAKIVDESLIIQDDLTNVIL